MKWGHFHKNKCVVLACREEALSVAVYSDAYWYHHTFFWHGRREQQKQRKYNWDSYYTKNGTSWFNCDNIALELLMWHSLESKIETVCRRGKRKSQSALTFFGFISQIKMLEHRSDVAELSRCIVAMAVTRGRNVFQLFYIQNTKWKWKEIGQKENCLAKRMNDYDWLDALIDRCMETGDFTEYENFFSDEEILS